MTKEPQPLKDKGLRIDLTKYVTGKDGDSESRLFMDTAVASAVKLAKREFCISTFHERIKGKLVRLYRCPNSIIYDKHIDLDSKLCENCKKLNNIFPDVVSDKKEDILIDDGILKITPKSSRKVKLKITKIRKGKIDSGRDGK